MYEMIKCKQGHMLFKIILVAAKYHLYTLFKESLYKTTSPIKLRLNGVKMKIKQKDSRFPTFLSRHHELLMTPENVLMPSCLVVCVLQSCFYDLK